MYYSKTNPVEIEFARMHGILKCAVQSCLGKVYEGLYCNDCQLCDVNVAFKPKRNQIVNFNGTAYYCQPAGLMYLHSRPNCNTNCANHTIRDRSKLTRPTEASIEQLLANEKILKQQEAKEYILNDLAQLNKSSDSDD